MSYQSAFNAPPDYPHFICAFTQHLDDGTDEGTKVRKAIFLGAEFEDAYQEMKQHGVELHASKCPVNDQVACWFVHPRFGQVGVVTTDRDADFANLVANKLAQRPWLDLRALRRLETPHQGVIYQVRTDGIPPAGLPVLARMDVDPMAVAIALEDGNWEVDAAYFDLGHDGDPTLGHPVTHWMLLPEFNIPA